MKRSGGLLLATLALVGSAAQAAPRRNAADRALEQQLQAHISELASDAYGGREPGTEGETLTLKYLARQWSEIGLESGTNDPSHSWFAPVTLMSREPYQGVALFSRKGRRVYVPAAGLAVFTTVKRGVLDSAPVLFVGDGTAPVPRADLAGRVAMMLEGDGPTLPSRQAALLSGGAAAVLTVLNGARTLAQVVAQRAAPRHTLAFDDLRGDLEAFITPEGLERALAGTGQTPAALVAAARQPGFAPRPLDLAVTLEATSREVRINTHNLIGKLPGRRPGSGVVALFAHWDHFGECGEKAAVDPFCNGAVDNASGVAVLTEVARRMSSGPQPDRDIYFIATTAEEMGLLGAHAFAENPPVPLKSIVAAFNIDTVAIAPAGGPFAIVGKGLTPLDGHIAKVAAAQKKTLVDPDMARAFVRRQDGWALLQHDVPAVMVSTAWGDPARMEAYMARDYHRVSDRPDAAIELGGAADDVNFLVALARWFADPRRVPTATAP